MRGSGGENHTVPVAVAVVAGGMTVAGSPVGGKGPNVHYDCRGDRVGGIGAGSVPRCMWRVCIRGQTTSDRRRQRAQQWFRSLTSLVRAFRLIVEFRLTMRTRLVRPTAPSWRATKNIACFRD